MSNQRDIKVITFFTETVDNQLTKYSTHHLLKAKICLDNVVRGGASGTEGIDDPCKAETWTLDCETRIPVSELKSYGLKTLFPRLINVYYSLYK